MNNNRHMTQIMAEQGCTKHHAKKYQPCWTISSGRAGSSTAFAICNYRAKAAGFNGVISSGSLRRSR